MANFFKSTKGKIITIVLALVLVVGGIAGYFIFEYGNKLEYDFETGMIVKNRVDKAQYLPNLNLLVENTQQTQLMSATPDQSNYLADLSFDLEDYQEIVDELAIITGTATRLDTNIMEIKEEIYTVLNMVPAFGKWFQLPHYFEAEHAQDGYNNYYYKLDYDKTSEKISIIRMTWSYTCDVYSSSNNKIYSSYYNDDIEQYQIMQVNYYYNSANKEVVECSVVDFARFNNDFYPIQSQYLANIQDTSTTKIQTVLRKELCAYEDKITDNPGGNIDGGLDIDTCREDGVMKKVVQLNYTDANNVELIKIEQNSNTDYYSDINTTNLAYYLKESENAIYFVDAWDYYDADNSFDEIELKNIFHLRTYNLSKDSIIDSFKNSHYYTRQVMGIPGSSSNTVCTQCYNRTIDSGLLVYKCNHNKNKETVARAIREVVSSSEAYQNEKYELITWNISKHLSKFANNVGISNQIIENYSTQLCKELNNEYQFENNLDVFLTEISKDYLGNISLAKDVKNLYNTIKKQSKELKVKDLNKSAISSEIKLENLNETTTISNNKLTINANATIKSSILLENNAKYSLGLVLYNNARNINYTLLTNYVVYNGNDLSLTLSGTYNISNFTLKDKDTKAHVSTGLTLGYVLLKESELNDVVCSNYNNANITSGTFTNFENEINGFECVYQPKIENNALKLIVACTDIEEPEVSLRSLNNSKITLSSGAKVYDLFSLINITDNDAIKKISILHDDEKYNSMNETLIAGTNKIVAIDRTGNTATLTFAITLN